MLNFIAQAGHAATIVDFTSDVSLLLTGLIGVTWFAAGVIAAMALYEWRTQATSADDDATLSIPTVTMYRHAA
jgi:hypothetical protein